MTIFRNNTGRSETFGNNETQRSALKDLNTNNSEDTEVKQKYESEKKLDEESSEREHKPAADIPYVGTADVDICAQELKDPSGIPEQTSEVGLMKDDEVAKEAVGIDICRSELKPTPLPAFGGLANVDVCAEEISHPSESTDANRDLGSPNPSPPNGEQSESQDESFVETPSHIEQDVGKPPNEMSDDCDDDGGGGHTEDAEQGVSEMVDTLLEDTDSEKKSTEQVYVEDSSKSTIEKDVPESPVEAGQESEEHIEENDDSPDNEDQEEINHEYSSTNDFVEDVADSTSDINSKSLMEMKGAYIDYGDETNDSKSEVIDVLDEADLQVPTREAENSTDEQSTSKYIDAIEEDLLETPKPVSQLNNSESEVIDDMISNEILNTDVMEASEKDLNTENVNEGSDLDSDGCDSEEMDLDISNIPQQNMVKTEDEEDDGTHDTEPKKAEEAEPRPLERETEVIGEEHPTELQEQTENDADQDDQLEEHRDKSQESTLESENLENTDSSEPKVSFLFFSFTPFPFDKKKNGLHNLYFIL